MTDEQIRAGLRALDEALTCLAERHAIGHPPCDYCGERLGTPEQRAAVRVALAVFRWLAVDDPPAQHEPPPRLTNEEDTKALWLTRRQMPGTLKG